jgi:hypothetical protein
MANINISDPNPIENEIFVELSAEEQAALAGGGLFGEIIEEILGAVASAGTAAAGGRSKPLQKSSWKPSKKTGTIF